MQGSEAAKAPAEQQTRNLSSVLRERLGGRNGLIAVAILAVGGGLVLNWSWLVAAGIAPLILGILPCVAMCALGLCANKMMGGGKSSCSSSETPLKTAENNGSSTTGAIKQEVADQNRESRHDSALEKNAP